MKYYCIGIKGSGMSALASILHDLGNTVVGYDDDPSYKYTMEGLINRGIEIYSTNEHELEQDIIVTYSKAFSSDHKEMKRCREKGLKFIEYFDYLYRYCLHDCKINKIIVEGGKLILIFENGIHGKTTTSSLLKTALDGEVNYFIGDGSGFADKKNNLMVMESCEYNKHFLHYYPSIAIITNIDRDHTECYENMDDLINTFKEFSERANVVICSGDDLNIRRINFNTKVIYYGLNENNDVVATNIKKTTNGNTFDVVYNNENIGSFFIPLYGDHMILDCLACITTCLYLNKDIESIKERLKGFVNAKRRFKEVVVGDTIVIDDYAHHPAEINATLESARQKYPDKKIIAVFMPNTYSRYRDYADEFVCAFNKADYTFLTKVVSDREKKEDYGNIDSIDIIKHVNGEILEDDF